MIALRIVPVELADPAAAALRRDGAGVLVPAQGATAWMEHGEDGEGWYTVHAAVAYMMCYRGFNRHAEGRQYVRCVVTDDSEIVAEVGYIKGQLVALMVSHFSSPVDETDVFVDTPLLTLPDTHPAPDALAHDVVAMLQTPEQRVAAWNAVYPRGCKVLRYKLMHPRADVDQVYDTYGEAFLDNAGNPVIRLWRFSGYVHLDSLEPLEAEVQEAKAA